MRQILICGLLAFFGAQAEAKPILNQNEEFALLRSIDEICGDSWCEGEANWSFEALHCDDEINEGCQLSLIMMPYPFSDRVALPDRELTCELSGFMTRDQLVVETKRGLQYTPELYDAIGYCIFDLLDRFGPMYVPLDSSCPALFKKNESLNIQLKGELEGLDASLWAVTRLIRERAKVDPSCILDTYPYYRDQGSCEQAGLTESCYLPTAKGAFHTLRTLGEPEVQVLFNPEGNSGK